MKHGRGLWAALFTLVVLPGFGLAMAGRFRRALIWLGVELVIMGLFIVTPWAVALFPVPYVGSAIDAYFVGRRSEQRLRLFTLGPAALIVSTFAMVLAVRAYVVEAFRLPSSSMYPTLHINDHVFVEKLSIHWHSPERGELLAFVYPCDLRRDYIKRVAALAGDTVEVRCNVLYVNGNAVPSTLVDANASYRDYDEMHDAYYPKQASLYGEVIDGHSYETFHDPERPARDKLTNRIDGDARDFPSTHMHAVASCANAEDAGPHVDEVQGTLVTTVPPESAKACEPQLHYVVPAGHVFVLGDNRNNSNDSRIWGSVPTSLVKGRVTGIWYSKFESGRIGRVK